MCKRKYRLIRIIIAAVVIVIMCSGCGGTAEEKKKEAEIVEVVPGYVVDVEDPRELAGLVDYVFVAVLTDTGEVKDISHERELPCTVYEAEVLENLKGNLQTEESILLDKDGGYSQSEGVIYQYQEDYMPKSGDVCLIYAFARDDGSLVASAKNSSIKIADSKEEDYTKSREYQKAIEGVANQIIID